jgi:hypothetical protein
MRTITPFPPKRVSGRRRGITWLQDRDKLMKGEPVVSAPRLAFPVLPPEPEEGEKAVSAKPATKAHEKFFAPAKNFLNKINPFKRTTRGGNR